MFSIIESIEERTPMRRGMLKSAIPSICTPGMKRLIIYRNAPSMRNVPNPRVITRNRRDRNVMAGQRIAFIMDRLIMMMNAVLKSGIEIPPRTFVIRKNRLTSSKRKTASFISCLISFLSLFIIILPEACFIGKINFINGVYKLFY